MHGCPGDPHGGIAAGGVGLHSPCTGGSSGMCLVTAYTCCRYNDGSTLPTVPCEGIQARGGGSGGVRRGREPAKPGSVMIPWADSDADSCNSASCESDSMTCVCRLSASFIRMHAWHAQSC